jgi:DNA-binding transcriptional regulator YiaG
MSLSVKLLNARGARRAKRVATSVSKARAISAASPIAALRVSLGMPRGRFARLVGRTERALIEWENGRAQPQGLSQQRVHELERLTESLAKLFDIKTLGVWFETPNAALGGFKPVEIIERGESDKLWRMVFELESGSHV